MRWSVHDYKNSPDRLILLPDGTLRHYLYSIIPEKNDPLFKTKSNTHEMQYDYPPGKYCMDKVIFF